MGLFNDNYKNTLEEAKIAPNFVKYEEKKNAKMQEVANQLRKDLNFALAPNNREFLLSVFSSFHIKSKEAFYDYHSPDIFTPHEGDETSCGFNPTELNLAKLIDKLNMRNGVGSHSYNRDFLFNNIEWETYTYDTARNVDEGGTIYYKSGFVAKDLSSRRVNELIDGELWNFYKALKNGNEEEIKGSLENVCAVLELNSSLQKLWTRYVGNEIINEHIDEFKKDLFKNCSMASSYGNPVNLDKNLTAEVKKMRSEYRATRKELETLIENNVYDAFKKHDKIAFKKAFDSLEYATYIKKLEEFSRKSKEYDKKFDILYKEYVRKEKEAENKKKNVYQEIASRYDKIDEPKMEKFVFDKKGNKNQPSLKIEDSKMLKTSKENYVNNNLEYDDSM